MALNSSLGHLVYVFRNSSVQKMARWKISPNLSLKIDPTSRGRGGEEGTDLLGPEGAAVLSHRRWGKDCLREQHEQRPGGKGERGSYGK